VSALELEQAGDLIATWCGEAFAALIRHYGSERFDFPRWLQAHTYHRAASDLYELAGGNIYGEGFPRFEQLEHQAAELAGAKPPHEPARKCRECDRKRLGARCNGCGAISHFPLELGAGCRFCGSASVAA
jgi:hypothetical protein